MNVGKPFLTIFSLICFATLVFAALPTATPAPTAYPTPTATCTDSDYGINPLVRGKCSPDGGKTVGIDACITVASAKVSPITTAAVAPAAVTPAASTPSTSLREYYCDWSSPKRSVFCNVKAITCPTGYECVQGACVKKSACSDSDAGSIYAQGTCKDASPQAFVKIVKKDVCVDSSKLTEFYCGPNDYCTRKSVTCRLGCKDGACLQCADSDAGMKPNVVGTCKTESATLKDSCIDNRYVMEYYCSTDAKGVATCARTSVYCQHGCSKGACVSATPVPESVSQPPAAVPPEISLGGLSLFSLLGVMVLIGVIGAMAFWFLRFQQRMRKKHR